MHFSPGYETRFSPRKPAALSPTGYGLQKLAGAPSRAVKDGWRLGGQSRLATSCFAYIHAVLAYSTRYEVRGEEARLVRFAAPLVLL
jgi:hypothetical protein